MFWETSASNFSYWKNRNSKRHEKRAIPWKLKKACFSGNLSNCKWLLEIVLMSEGRSPVDQVDMDLTVSQWDLQQKWKPKNLKRTTSGNHTLFIFAFLPTHSQTVSMTISEGGSMYRSHPHLIQGCCCRTTVFMFSWNPPLGKACIFCSELYSFIFALCYLLSLIVYQSWGLFTGLNYFFTLAKCLYSF